MKVIDGPEGVVRLEGEVSAAPAEVFRYFTEPGRLSQWWAEEAAVDLRTDGEYELSWPSQALRLLGQYVVVEPPGRLTFTWAFAHEAESPRTVDVHFSPLDGRTRVVIDHTHGNDPDERQGYVDGWKFFIERLRVALAVA